MYCLLCNNHYPDTMLRCDKCDHDLKLLKPYSPHLSQIIRLGEGVCTGGVSPKLLDIAVENLLKRLDEANDNYFEHEENYSEEDKLILEDILNKILEHAEFLRTSLEELQKASNMLDFKKIYNALDKARISETMLLNASRKLAELTEKDMEELAKTKGIVQKKSL